METQKIDVMVADASHEVTLTLFWRQLKTQRKCAEQGLQNVHMNMLLPK